MDTISSYRKARIFYVWAAMSLLALAGRVDGQTDDESTTTPAASAATIDATGSAVENSVVKVFSTVRYPDPYKPWTKQTPTEISGSGVVIEGNRILTCAHVVLYASEVQVQGSQGGDRISATVEAISPSMDLAVLRLEDKGFFDTHAALPRASVLPQIKDAVMAYGYPLGGTSLSITKGIVSRIEFTPYNYPASGLRIQIDAAINPGNSGRPAVVDNKMIGLAFSTARATENIGYIIPCEEIDLFLKNISVDGHYHGKPAMLDEMQTLENPALRPFLKLDKNVTGMVVHEPYSTNADYPLKEWDVVTKIGDTPIDDEGKIRLAGNLQVRFSYLVQKIASDGYVPLTVVRDGKVLKVKVPVPATRTLAIPNLAGAYPPYFVYGPMVFSTATDLFVAGLMRSSVASRLLDISKSPLATRIGDKPAFEGEGLVVVSSPLFPHRLSEGYSNPQGCVVGTVNGIPIRNLDHLVEVLRDCQDKFVTFEFQGRGAEALVFPRAEMLEATDDILTDNGIRSQGSPEVMAVWNAKGEK